MNAIRLQPQGVGSSLDSSNFTQKKVEGWELILSTLLHRGPLSSGAKVYVWGNRAGNCSVVPCLLTKNMTLYAVQAPILLCHKCLFACEFSSSTRCLIQFTKVVTLNSRILNLGLNSSPVGSWYMIYMASQWVLSGLLMSKITVITNFLICHVTVDFHEWIPTSIDSESIQNEIWNHLTKANWGNQYMHSCFW